MTNFNDLFGYIIWTIFWAFTIYYLIGSIIKLFDDFN